jgi:hypothetical protein
MKKIFKPITRILAMLFLAVASLSTAMQPAWF